MIKQIILLSIITLQHLFAIVSIAPVEIGENAGFHGYISAALESKRGNTDTDSYKSGTKIAYDNNYSYVTWAEVSGEYGESNSVENTNKLYMHLRHIQAVTDKVIRAEALAQIQNDKFKLINKRVLGGAGLRFNIFELLDNSNGYLGVGGFYEYINYTSNDSTENNLRLNNYFTYTIEFDKSSLLSYTLYYQPLATDFSDYIQSHNLQLKLNILKKLYLNFKVSYDFDSNPPEGLKKEDFYQETAFVFEF